MWVWRALQVQHPPSDRPPDLVQRIFLEEMDPATVTSVCAGHSHVGGLALDGDLWCHVSVGRRPSPCSADGRRYCAISSPERVRRTPSAAAARRRGCLAESFPRRPLNAALARLDAGSAVRGCPRSAAARLHVGDSLSWPRGGGWPSNQLVNLGPQSSQGPLHFRGLRSLRGCGFKLKPHAFAPLTFSASAMSLASRACAASLTSLSLSALIKDEGRLYATQTFPLEGSS
jgi:hypothetical protein